MLGRSYRDEIITGMTQRQRDDLIDNAFKGGIWEGWHEAAEADQWVIAEVIVPAMNLALAEGIARQRGLL